MSESTQEALAGIIRWAKEDRNISVTQSQAKGMVDFVKAGLRARHFAKAYVEIYKETKSMFPPFGILLNTACEVLDREAAKRESMDLPSTPLVSRRTCRGYAWLGMVDMGFGLCRTTKDLSACLELFTSEAASVDSREERKFLEEGLEVVYGAHAGNPQLYTSERSRIAWLRLGRPEMAPGEAFAGDVIKYREGDSCADKPRGGDPCSITEFAELVAKHIEDIRSSDRQKGALYDRFLSAIPKAGGWEDLQRHMIIVNEEIGDDPPQNAIKGVDPKSEFITI